MNNEQSALLLQLMQSLNKNASEDLSSQLRSPIDILVTLRPMLSPREQKFIDLMIKFRELRVLMDELFEYETM